MRGVLLDFSGTLFHVEDARSALLATLGEDFLRYAPALRRWGAINGSDTPDNLPEPLRDVWQQRDLSTTAHRAAYSGLAIHAGLTPDEAELVYDRGITAAGWRAYPDSIEVLRRLYGVHLPVAVVSNIGWDPRPVLRESDVDGLIRTLVLSYERGLLKPDPAIFSMACREIGVDPAEALMIGDNPVADAAAAEIGCAFTLVDSSPDRPADTLLRAVASLI